MANEEYLKKHKFIPLKTLDINKINSFSEMAEAMSHTAFTGRQLGEAVDVAVKMFSDKDCFKVLTLSGAMTMAKMGLVVCDMIDYGMADAVISTGALMSHGLIEAIGSAHFKDPGNLSDEELCRMRLNRVYDTLEPEENFEEMDAVCDRVFESLNADEAVCSYKICRELGKYLYNNAKGRGILKSAFIKNVPVFVPAFTDSELGIALGLFNRRREMEKKSKLGFNPFIDMDYYAELVLNAKKTGIFTIGGGVPRNWAQQIAVYLDLIKVRLIEKGKRSEELPDRNDPYNKPFSYAVRICPEPVHWGGLSGCTYSESVSWGKIVPKSEGGKYAEVLCDATVAWPIIIKAVMERLGPNK